MIRSIRSAGATRRVISRECATLVALAALTATGCDLYFGDKNTTEVCRAEADDPHDEFAPPERPLAIQTTRQAATPPPAISGGTMALTPDQDMVVAADSDRNLVYIVSLATESLVHTVPLEIGDEPGRVVVDSTNQAHVALRSGGAVATIDVATGEVLARHAVCAAPRGLFFEEASSQLLVACHGGELITLDPSTGLIVASVRLEVGLRDVIVDDEHIYVTVFRTAEAIVLDRNGTEVERLRPPGIDTFTFDFETGDQRPVRFEPAVAWRSVPRPGGGIVMLHQRGRDGEVSIGRGGYGGAGDCNGGVVHAAVTPMRTGEPVPANVALGQAVLPVDIALLSNGTESVVVNAGNGDGALEFGFLGVMLAPVNEPHTDFSCGFRGEYEAYWGQPIATVATATDTVVVQFREPAEVAIYRNNMMWAPIRVPLSGVSMEDTGHRIFHMNSGQNVACASCHPEGGDDSRTWEFNCIGPRRTQSLQFGILGTEPFHWDGDMDTFDTLVHEVFVGRMGGGLPQGRQIEFMASWLDTLRAPSRSAIVDAAVVERGRRIFNDAAVGCQACHSGAKFTNNQSVDVGTGGTFQVPSLIGLSSRAPFLHDGCAPTLRDRFTNPECGGGDRHGVVSGLTSQQLDDLVAYLETL